jgi:YVTN family beta-propeller protein
MAGMIADPRIGTQLAGYRIEALIGRGGMSVVYLAEDVRLKRKVALKLLSPDLAQSEKFRERFVRESELAASLDHPNIIPIFEAGESEGALYIAMRYVEGVDLGALIDREGRLEPDQTLRLLGQAAGALDAAHARGLIHRDVKPGNMLIAGGGTSGGQEHLYLSDFGVTKRSTSDSGITGTGQFVGTLDYAAPEQFEGKALDPRTDVYSLGCVLYQCLTGSVPFQRDTQAALVYAHLMSVPPTATDARPELSEEMDRVVARALSKAPTDRYASAGELVDAARKALAPAAPVTAPPQVSGRPAGRRTAMLLAGVGAVVVVAAVLVGVLLGRGGGSRGGPSPSPPTAGLEVLRGDRVARISQAGSDASLAKILPLPSGASSGPKAVVVAEGAVWVANEADGTVSRIEPVDNTVSARIKVGSSPDAIAYGEGSIWVVNRLSHSVSRIDPGSNKITATIPVNGPGFPSQITVGEGAVWVGVDGDYPLGTHSAAVHRIDPASNQDVASLGTVGFIWVVVTIGDGSVWAAENGGTLYRIDPVTNTIHEVARLGIPAAAITMSDGFLWVASTQGQVERIDPATGKVEATVAGGGSPIDCSTGNCTSDTSTLGIAEGQGIIWITNKVNGSISRILAAGTSPLREIATGQTPTGVAVGYGSVWVTVDAAG